MGLVKGGAHGTACLRTRDLSLQAAAGGPGGGMTCAGRQPAARIIPSTPGGHSGLAVREQSPVGRLSAKTEESQ